MAVAGYAKDPVTAHGAGRKQPERAMFLIRRIFYIMFFAAVAFVALDDDRRVTARTILHDGYAMIAGRAPPLPLERPLFLAQAGLDDCLRGTAIAAGDNDAFAEFCADLASFAASVVAPEEPEGGATPPAIPALERPERPAPRRAANDETDKDDAGTEGESGDETEKKQYARAPETARPPPPRCRVDASGAARINTDGVWTSSPPRESTGSPPEMRGRKSSRIVLVPQGCDVESPADAKVLYAGPFKGYLGIVILDAGKTERLIVAGLGEIAVQRGDSIARGATIGATSKTTAPALASAETAGEAALLYVEDASGAGPSG